MIKPTGGIETGGLTNIARIPRYLLRQLTWLRLAHRTPRRCTLLTSKTHFSTRRTSEVTRRFRSCAAYARRYGPARAAINGAKMAATMSSQGFAWPNGVTCDAALAIVFFRRFVIAESAVMTVAALACSEMMRRMVFPAWVTRCATPCRGLGCRLVCQDWWMSPTTALRTTRCPT